ncbi:hypothetical protein BDFB_007501 [Asbolus verrucosus]|uniref:Uncharacterized protein n=1 Tax=Asbolus verrucosus TaxID=1661398 RepID=A0A482V9J5_ASBVE|nr:hypothetical protein BDFB_007501 [Asbolus verrucosus]
MWSATIDATTKLPGPSILHPVIYNVATPPDKYCLPARNVTHACNRAFVSDVHATTTATTHFGRITKRASSLETTFTHHDNFSNESLLFSVKT